MSGGSRVFVQRCGGGGTEQYWHDRISGYMRGELHPQQALAPRVVLVAEGGEDIVGFIAGHLTRRFGCDGELEWLDVVAECRSVSVDQSSPRSARNSRQRGVTSTIMRAASLMSVSSLQPARCACPGTPD